MNKYKYIIIGGGMTADAAVEGIREIDRTGSVLLFSAETDPPYNRPPLSKSLWKDPSDDKIWRHTSEKNAEILLNSWVTLIDPGSKLVKTDLEQSYKYEKLLLATGGKVRKLPFGGDLVHYFRTLEDFRVVKKIAQQNKKFAVIGSGFIGSEIAAALSMNGNEVTLLDQGIGIGWNIFPVDIVEFLNEYYKKKNVDIITNFNVKDIRSVQEKILIQSDGGENIFVDSVVAGVGISLNLELAESIPLKIDNGINVNEYLQTTNEDIFAAGDVANFFNPVLNERIRAEHADNAKAMGKTAGRNMAGAKESYDYLPMFYSDLFDLGYEAVGKLDSRDDIIADWQEKYVKGILYYIHGDRVRGVLLWNVWDQTDAARKLIGLPGPVDKEELIGKIR